MKRLPLLLLILSPVLCPANTDIEIVEEFIHLSLELDGDEYLIETLKTYYTEYYGCFDEVALYRLDNAAVGGRKLIDVYPRDDESHLYGENIELRDVTGDGAPELVILHNTGGNDPLLCMGLFVLRPTMTGFEELYADAYMAPLIGDLDGDGDEEIHTFSAYQSSFLPARVHRAGFVDRVYEWDGAEYVRADPADYRDFYEGEGERREKFFLGGMISGLHQPAEILRDGQAVLAQLAVAGLDERYADWWASNQDIIRRAAEDVEEGNPEENWAEVYADFHSPDTLRAAL